MQKRAENEIFGLFLDSGTSDGLDIAYYGRSKVFEYVAMIRDHA